MELFASMSKPGWLFIPIQREAMAKLMLKNDHISVEMLKREEKYIYVNSKLRLQRSLIFIREETSRAQQKYEEQSNHLNES